jgi:hypothetical protein
MTTAREFGPTNVTLHQVTVAVELGDACRALRIADEFDPANLSPERRSRYLIELARAHAQRRDIPAAVATIESAYDLASEHACGTRMELAVNLNGAGGRESGSDRGKVVVETRGLEPLTPALQRQCSTN